jgi:NitT/TauT family transport system permease protein
MGLTVARWILGLLLGVLLGIPVGLMMGCSRRVYDSLEILVDFFRSIPIMALFPLALVLFGIGDRSKIFLSAWAALLYVLINAMYGARHAKEPRIMAARVFGASPWQVFTKVIFPDALPNIFVGIRMSISMSLVIVVASEMVMGTQAGLGRRVFDAALVYKMAEMYAVVIIAGALGYLSNKLFVMAESRLMHWAAK